MKMVGPGYSTGTAGRNTRLFEQAGLERSCKQTTSIKDHHLGGITSRILNMYTVYVRTFT